MVDYKIREENIGADEDHLKNLENTPFCAKPYFPPNWPYFINLQAYTKKSINFWKSTLTRSYLLNLFKNTKFSQKSGIWSPRNCLARSKIAVIIPFRSISNDTESGREQELTFYLYKMIVFLQLQRIEFKFYVIEQDWEDDFNRARLMNIGFVEARKEREEREISWDCYLFTDVDKFPVNFNLSMHCNNNQQTVHYLPYLGGYGGIAQFTAETILAINGFSNVFFGWGGEDQDVAIRVEEANKIFKKEVLIKKFNLIPNSNLYNKYAQMSPFIKSNLQKSLEMSADMYYNYKSSFFLETGHRGKGIDKGNAKSKNRQNLLSNAVERLSNDGLHNLKYKLLKVELEENFYIFGRYKVNFSREEDERQAQQAPQANGLDQNIDWVGLVLNHECLKSLASVKKCYDNQI